VPFVDLQSQQRALGAEIDVAIQRVISRCDFILGAAVREFEQHFADFVGTRHAVGVSSGLDALRLALTAAGVGPGTEVILPANTYIATALAVAAAGARPVLVDCDPHTYNIDVDRIAGAVSKQTRAIIPVHLTGQAADMDAVLDVAARHGLAVVEDAAQSHGAAYKGRPCGSLGIAGCFSFYPSKNLGAFGDGGMVTTDDEAIAERIRVLRDYGQRQKYEHVEKGLNARLDTLQAAVLDVKLPHLPRWNAARARHAEAYRRLLGGVGDLAFQGQVGGSTHIYHLFVVETARRDDLRAHLTAAQIQTGIHYPRPIHLQPAFADLGYREGDFPQAERLAGCTLSLPMFAELDGDQIERVAASVRRFFGAG
jgi:dTDP-4-amino-4,6-dideoxygalactose transaminase